MAGRPTWIRRAKKDRPRSTSPSLLFSQKIFKPKTRGCWALGTGAQRTCDGADQNERRSIQTVTTPRDHRRGGIETDVSIMVARSRPSSPRRMRHASAGLFALVVASQPIGGATLAVNGVLSSRATHFPARRTTDISLLEAFGAHSHEPQTPMPFCLCPYHAHSLDHSHGMPPRHT